MSRALNPSTRLRLAERAAMRRRFGYAALRVLRVGLRAAVYAHVARSLDGSRGYNGTDELATILRRFPRAVRKLQARWPTLRLDDPRSDP